MADIILNVSIKTPKLSQESQKIANEIKASLDKIPVDENLTKQLEALAEYYKSISKAAKDAKKSVYEESKQNEKLKREQEKTNAVVTQSEEKLNREREKTRKAAAQADLAEERLAQTRAKASNAAEKSVPKIDKLRKAYSNLLNSIQGSEKNYKKGAFSEITDQVKANLEQLSKLDPATEGYSETAKKLSTDLDKLSADFAQTKSQSQNFHGSITDIVGGFLKFQLAATLVMKPLQLIRSVLQDVGDTVVEVESDVVSLRRVLKDTFADNSDISDEIFALAEDYSRQYEDVNTIIQNFARTGMSFEESIDATKGALLGMNVAELDATESSEGLISIMTQFELQADDIVDIIDVFNKSADNAAVTTEKLLKALQRTGSSAKNANLTLEETTGIVTALSAATGRSGENLGTAVNSLIQYSSKNTALETFADLSSDTAKVVANYRAGAANILDVWRSVSKEIQTLTAEQADALDAYFNTAEGAELSAELSAELGEVYDELGGVYDTANTFRKNYFIALLKNMDQVDEAIKTAQTAAGYSAKENEQYLETYEARATALEAKWKKILNDEQGVLGLKKALVEGGDAILFVIEQTGGLRTTLLAVGMAGTAAFGAKSIDSIKKFTTMIKTADAASKSLNKKLVAISMAITAVSAIAGIISNAEEKFHEYNQATIESANENRENLKTLKDLERQYETLDPTSKEYKNVEEQIISLLGDKAEALEYLKGNQEAYTQAIKDSTSALKEEYETSIRLGYESAKSELKSRDVGDYADYSFENWISTEGLGLAAYFDSAILAKYGIKNPLGKLMSTNTTEAELNNYAVFSNVYSELTDALMDVAPGSKDANDLLKVIEKFETQLKEDKEYIDDYINSASYLFLDEWLENGNSFREGRDFSADKLNAIKYLIEQMGIEEDVIGFYRPMIENFVEEWIRENVEWFNSEAAKENEETTVELEDALSAVSDKYSEIKDELQEILDIQKEEEELAERQNALAEARAKLEEEKNKARQTAILDALRAERKEKEEATTLSEKQLAVEKARQALEAAKKQRRAYIYNAETGRFERQSVAESVKDAENELQDAIDALNQYIEDQAWDSVIESVENGNTSLSVIEALLTEWKTEYNGSDSVVQQILAAFKTGAGNVDYSDAEKNLADAEEEFQDYADQKLFDKIIGMLGSGEKITTEGAREILKKYKDIGASDEAIQSVSRKLEEYTGTQIILDRVEAAEKYTAYEDNGYFGSRLAANAFARAAVSDFLPPYISYETQAVDRIGIPTNTPVKSTVTNNNSNNNTYYINGLTVPQGLADALGLTEFCKNVPLLIND